jgi:hypothetical protein
MSDMRTGFIGSGRVEMHREILLAYMIYMAPKENRGAGVGNLPKEMEVSGSHSLGRVTEASH